MGTVKAPLMLPQSTIVAVIFFVFDVVNGAVDIVVVMFLIIVSDHIFISCGQSKFI